MPPEPDLSDADGSEASALRDPTELPLPDAATDLPTGGLDPASLQQALSAPANGSLPDGRRRAQGLLGQLQRRSEYLSGSCRTRLPVAAKIALQTAGVMTG